MRTWKNAQTLTRLPRLQHFSYFLSNMQILHREIIEKRKAYEYLQSHLLNKP